MFFSGGLAQLVEQRALKNLLREWIDPVGLPSNTSRQSFYSVNFSEHTTAHPTEHKKATQKSGFLFI